MINGTVANATGFAGRIALQSPRRVVGPFATSGDSMFLDITDELLHASVTELAPLLRERKITSAALTDAYLDRLDKFGTKLGAVVTITKDLARKEAAQADAEM